MQWAGLSFCSIILWPPERNLCVLSTGLWGITIRWRSKSIAVVPCPWVLQQLARAQMHSCFADKSMFSRGLVSTKILFTFLVGMQSMSVSSFKGKTSSSVWFLVLALGKICILIWVSCRGSGVKFLHIESYRAKNDKWHSFPLTRPTTYINTHLVDWCSLPTVCKTKRGAIDKCNCVRTHCKHSKKI